MLRARERITSHFRIPSSSHLEPIFTRKILNVAFATPAVLLPQIDSIWPKSGREFLEGILSRALSGLFLFAGDQGGVEQKNRVRPYFNLRGLSPQKKRSYTIPFKVSQSVHSRKLAKRQWKSAARKTYIWRDVSRVTPWCKGKKEMETTTAIQPKRGVHRMLMD